jgi:MFS family permease
MFQPFTKPFNESVHQFDADPRARSTELHDLLRIGGRRASKKNIGQLSIPGLGPRRSGMRGHNGLPEREGDVVQTQSEQGVVGQEAMAHRWWMLTLLLMGQFMALIDVFVVNVAAPGISLGLHTTGSELQLIVGGFVVAYAVLLITGARLGAMYGSRTLFIVGVAVFTAASLGCGLAPTSTLLFVARLVQGAGTAAMIPQVMSLIQSQFSGPDRAKALSAYGVILAAGATVGIVVGGLIVGANVFGLQWRPVFFVNVPIGIVLLILAPRFLPPSPRMRNVRMDVNGLLLAAPAVLLVIAPLVLGTAYGWPLWLTACIPIGLILGWVFIRYEGRVSARGGAPLLNTAVFRASGFASGLGTLACMQVAYGGFLFVFTLYLELALHDSAFAVAEIYLPMAITFGVAGFLWRRLPGRLHPFIAPSGMGICAVGYLWSTIAVGPDSKGLLLGAGLAVLGVGLGLSASPVITQSLQSVAGPRAADASGALTTTVQLGQALGIAILGAIYFASAQMNNAQVTAPRSGSLIMIGSVLAVASMAGALVSLPLVRNQLSDRLVPTVGQEQQ